MNKLVGNKPVSVIQISDFCFNAYAADFLDSYKNSIIDSQTDASVFCSHDLGCRIFIVVNCSYCLAEVWVCCK